MVKKYYSAGGQRIAMRDGGTLYWLLTDHLGETAYTVSGTTKTGELRYRPFGVTRFASGTTPTSYRFTGQREEAALGLYFYNARWYDPALGHFLSPDALVPEAGNALDYHRYAYVRFNPLKYTDPSGHWLETAWDIFSIGLTLNDIREEGLTWQNGLALAVDVTTAILPGVPAFAGVTMKGGKAVAHADDLLGAAKVAGRLTDSARTGTRLVERLAQVGTHSDEGRALVRQLAEISAQGPRNGLTVLGRFRAEPGYKSYIEKAHEMGATYFSTPNSPGYDVWDALMKAGIDPWEVNRQFLDDAIARGDKFFVEANIKEVLEEARFANTYLRRELNYLLSKGYKIEGQWLLPGE